MCFFLESINLVLLIMPSTVLVRVSRIALTLHLCSIKKESIHYFNFDTLTHYVGYESYNAILEDASPLENIP